MPSLNDLIKEYFNLQNTKIKVKIAGTGKFADFDDNASCAVSSLEFDASTDGEASVCVIRWVSDCYTSDGFTLNEEFNTVQIGAKFEVWAGYYFGTSEYLAKIFSGFIFSFSLDIQNGIEYLEISGMDAKMWMMANKFTQFKSSEQTLSKIVKDIQSNYSQFSGAEINIPDEPTSIRPGIHQRNESDFDYLRRIADITGSFFYVMDGKFMFTPIKPNNNKEIIIEPICEITEENFLKKIKFVSNIIGIPKSVSTSFTKNEEYKNSVSSDISASSISNNVGNGNKADSLTNNISQNNIIKIIDNSLNSPDFAKFIAKAEYYKRAINLAKCEIVCNFLPDIKIGSPVQMSGFGEIIDNKYIITSLNHKYDGEGFRTTIGLSTDAFSQSSTSGGINYSSYFSF